MSTVAPSLTGTLVGRLAERAFALARRQDPRQDAEVTLDEMAGWVTELRTRIEALAARGRVPGDTQVEQVVDAPVPGDWVRPAGGDASGRVVMHLHGGAFVVCSPATHRSMARSLARSADAVAWVPAYRLAPEHVFPAALDDAVASYRWLVEDQGVDPSRVAVSGDSAGGGLALSMLLRLRDEGVALPACYIGLSPWTDLAATSPSVEENNGRDVMFGTVPDGMAGRLGELYHHDTTDPRVSPVYADLHGLPPMLVHVGAHELIRDDGLRLVERARDHGVPASAGTFAGMWHVFQVFPIPEARRSFREIGGFVRRHTGR